MKNMKVAKKLILGFIIVTLLTAGVGGVGMVGIMRMDSANSDMFVNEIKPITAISNIINHTQQIRIKLRTLAFYSGQPEKISVAEKEMSEGIAELDVMLAAYDGMIRSTAAREAFDTAVNVYTSVFKPLVSEILAGAYAGESRDDLYAMIDRNTEKTSQMIDNFTQCINVTTSDAEAAELNISNLASVLMTTIIVVIPVAIGMALILAFYISGLISKPLTLLSAFFTRFGATGDLSLTESDKKNIESKGKDEIGDLIGSAAGFVSRLIDINETLIKVAAGDLTADLDILSEKDTLGLSLSNMVNSLNSMFTDIRAASGQVSAGAEQIAHGAQELASGSSEQAASIQEFSLLLNEMREKTRLNAENSAKAQDSNNNAGRKLEESILSMEQMLRAMQEIDESSRNITKVIKVIDDIAFQTNILALNAAVEAARAGQHGKGFAVVADEVRNLASKSAAAAKETAALIEGSSEKVAEGNHIVEETNASLEAVSVEASAALTMLQDVAAASAEQAKSINEINRGIEDISSVIQANSASAEQSSASAQEMSVQSETLNEIVARFRLKKSAPEPAPSPEQWKQTPKPSTDSFTMLDKY